MDFRSPKIWQFFRPFEPIIEKVGSITQCKNINPNTSECLIDACFLHINPNKSISFSYPSWYSQYLSKSCYSREFPFSGNEIFVPESWSLRRMHIPTLGYTVKRTQWYHIDGIYAYNMFRPLCTLWHLLNPVYVLLSFSHFSKWKQVYCL